MNDLQRCPAEQFGLRCELVTGHHSAHLAHNGDVLHHWRNRTEPGHGRRVSFEWAEPEPDRTGS